MLAEVLVSFMAYYNEPVRATVIDTGINKTAYDIPLCPESYDDEKKQPLKLGGDDIKHGTAVAGIVHQFAVGCVLGSVNNEICSIEELKKAPNYNYCINFKKVDMQEVIVLDSFVRVTRQAIKEKSDIINISWSSKGAYEPEKKEMVRALDLGIPIVVAAGNDSVSLDFNKRYPASYDSRMFVVGALKREYQPTTIWDKNTPTIWQLKSSNYGYNVDAWVVGEDLLTAGADGAIEARSGTSFSAPAVTGAFVATQLKYKNKWMRKLLNIEDPRRVF